MPPGAPLAAPSEPSPRLIRILGLLTFTDMFGYAIVVPILPFAARRFGAQVITVGAIFASYSLCQLFAAPLLGALSDRYGRRLLLLVSQAGSVVGFLLLTFAGSVWPLFLSRVVDGLTAGNISLIWAAVLDHYPAPSWGRRFANLSTATGVGILGGLLMSSLLAPYGLGLVAWVAIGLTLANMVLALGSFPERPVRAAPSAPAGRLAGMVRDSRHRTMRRVVTAGLLSTIAQSAFLLALPLFLAQRLHFGAQASAVTITGLLALAAAFQLLALAPVVARLGERRTAFAGFGLVFIGGMGLAAAAAIVTVLLCAAAVMLGIVLLNPSLTALLGAANRAFDEGAIMGVNQSMASAGQMLGPLVGYGALAVFPGPGYGIACALLAAVGWAVVSRASFDNEPG